MIDGIKVNDIRFLVSVGVFPLTLFGYISGLKDISEARRVSVVKVQQELVEYKKNSQLALLLTQGQWKVLSLNSVVNSEGKIVSFDKSLRSQGDRSKIHYVTSQKTITFTVAKSTGGAYTLAGGLVKYDHRS